ncbi:hypothetical protein, partial [Okeania hirsuta]|uniref:hypothetical protein n=1 Tax=Okeania hirsuta TaxID=1458930 RepID=UPI000FADD531
FVKYRDYAEADWEEVLLKKEREGALQLSAEKLASLMLVRGNKGKMRMEELPLKAQYAPIKGIIAHDLDGDGWEEVILTGNDFNKEVGNGPDAGLQGLVLSRAKEGSYGAVDAQRAGLSLRGDMRAMVRVFTEDGPAFLASENRGPLHLYRSSHTDKEALIFEALPLDNRAIQYFEDGRKKALLFTYGSGYLGQSSRKMIIPKDVMHMEVFDSSGKVRLIKYKE